MEITVDDRPCDGSLDTHRLCPGQAGQSGSAVVEFPWAQKIARANQKWEATSLE